MHILLTGATGFVGRHLYPALAAAGHTIVCASRDPRRAAAELPDRFWRPIDLRSEASVRAALRDCHAAYYLVHALTGAGAHYPRYEEEAATLFRRAADDAGLSRIVYLGGMAPAGESSRHLASRLRTGEVLRAGATPTFELRASMIIGAGSASWRICRDLAVRLPVMILPRWLRSRTQPIAIDDVVVALLAALGFDAGLAGDYDVPGPDTMTAREILQSIARLAGIHPLMLDVPLLTPHLSAYWIRLVTRADAQLAAELVEGLRTDILARNQGIWTLLPDHQRIPFDRAARQALEAEEPTVSKMGHAIERAVQAAARRA